jgi:phosphohistidine phosphatase
MHIYLLRHGIAAGVGEGGVTRDAERPLTNEGRAKMKLAAKGMRALGLKFDYVFTSPYVRTVQTARIVAEEFGLGDELVEVASLAAGRVFSHRSGHGADALLEVGAYDFESALLVGHMPDVSELASVLLSGGRGLGIEFKKGALGCVEVSALPPRAPGTLRWLLTSKQLQLIGE